MDTTKQLDTAKLLQRAVWILGQRNHTTQELGEKLRLSVQRKAQRDNTPELTVSEQQIAEVIEWCQQQGYLNDNQFCEDYIVQRSRRGYGLLRIRMELQRKGLSDQLISHACEVCAIDWQACAKIAAEKKAGRRWPTTFEEKMKLQRYLYSRGFHGEDIRAIF